jgi:hypothetical protein
MLTSFEYLPYLQNGYFGGTPLRWVFLLLLLAGATSLWRRRTGSTLLLLGLVLPSLLMSIQGLAHRPWAYQRLLIFQLPILLLLVAEGVSVLSARRRGLGALVLSLLLLGWWPGFRQLFEEKPRRSGSPLLAAARFVEEHFEPGDLLVADRSLDLLHLRNYLPPRRFAGMTLEPFLDDPEARQGRFFFWSRTRLASTQPRVETQAGSMVLYAGEHPLRALQLEALTTLSEQPGKQQQVDCHGLLCRLEKALPAASGVDHCAFWEQHRTVTRRERVARIGRLFR